MSKRLAQNLDSDSADTARQIIKNLNGLAKTICSPLDDNQSWDLFFENLKKNSAAISDEKKSEPIDDDKLTATTLLPSNGKIKLFKPRLPEWQVMVGVLFDMDACERPEQYVFSTNAASKDWFNVPGKKIPDNVLKTRVSLEELQTILRKSEERGVILENNELLVKVSPESLSAVFATKDELFDRLNALDKQILIKQELGLNLPILIITPEAGVSVYTKDRQKRDIQEALLHPETPVYQLVNNKIASQFLIEEKTSTPSERLQAKVSTDDDSPHIGLCDDAMSVVAEYLSLSDLDTMCDIVCLDDQIEKELAIISTIAIERRTEQTSKEIKDRIEQVDEKELFTCLNNETIEPEQLPFIYAALFHLKQQDPRKLNNLFHSLMREGFLNNKEVILCCLQYLSNKPKHRNKPEPYLVFQHDMRENYCGGSYEEEYLKKWTPLINCVLLNDSEINQLIIEKFKDSISLIIEGLDKIEKILSRFEDVTNDQDNPLLALGNVRSAKNKFLSQLDSIDSPFYQLKSSEKIDLIKKTKDELGQLKTKQEVINYYEERKNSLWLTQKRYSIFDHMVGKGLSNSERQFSFMVNEKLTNTKNLTTTSQEDKENKIIPADENLAEFKTKIISLLENKQAEIKSEKNLASLFFFNRSTADKLMAIQQTLDQVKTINNKTEFELFFKAIFGNESLIGRRSLGFFSSKTSDNLQNLYNQYMMAASTKKKSF